MAKNFFLESGIGTKLCIGLVAILTYDLSEKMKQLSVKAQR